MLIKKNSSVSQELLTMALIILYIHKLLRNSWPTLCQLLDEQFTAELHKNAFLEFKLVPTFKTIKKN